MSTVGKNTKYHKCSWKHQKSWATSDGISQDRWDAIFRHNKFKCNICGIEFDVQGEPTSVFCLECRLKLQQ